MQRKIEELAAGVCSSQSSILQFTPEKLEVEVLEGTVYTGEFSIKSIDGIPVAGKIYSTSPRMECPKPEFQGTDITQKFQFHSEGMTEGDTLDGNFHIISNQGEYILPFFMSVSRKYPDSSMGKIRSIFEFANLARKCPEEAVKVFAQPEFVHIFGSQENRERLIYQGLCHKPCTRAQVEEFLIAARKKNRVYFQVEEAEREFSGVTAVQKHQIILKKNEWGHFAIEVIPEGAWLMPVKQQLTEEDFVGSRGIVEYMIEPQKLHAGKNYGRLTLQTPFQKEQMELCVTREAVKKEHTGLMLQKKQEELTRDYLDFGLRKTVTGVWAKQTSRKLEELSELEPDNLWYLLAKAQVFLVNRQRQEAEWILDAFPRHKADKESPLYAYYLYLCTLREPEPVYVNKCTNQIRKIYHKHQEDSLLLWILLFLDEELNYSKGRKLEVIAKYLRREKESVLLYLEAWRILAKEPFLLNRAGTFERKILNFAVKHQALTKGMVQQVMKLVPEIPVYDPVWYQILTACYQELPGKETLQAVCSYCIKGQRYGEKYWKWYQMGISEELRIAGLYEAWVLSADKKQLEKLPKALVLYFQSYSNLSSGAQTRLYEAVINSKAQWKGIWPHYRKNMEEFALRQLRNGKIDRSLATVYREVLTLEFLTEERADDMAKILFACEVVCENPRVRNLVVCQHTLKREQVVPVVHGKGYVNIYGSSWQILLEDAQGRRFLPKEELTVTPLMDSEAFLEQGMAYARRKLPYLLKYFDKKKIWQTYEKEDIVYLQMLVESPAVSEAYRRELRPQMVAYFYDNYTGDALDEFLLNLSFQSMEKRTREKIMELLVARRHYARAYELLLNYGCEYISPAKLVYVICYRLEEQEEADDFLLGLCRNVFLRGKYNERILVYMCRYFYGSLVEMLKLWKTARNFEVDTYELEEHCLKRFLYTGDFSVTLEQVFENYGKSHGRDLIIQAYLTKMCHQYVSRDAVVAEYVFRKLGSLLKEKQELNDICRLGFLKWCASGVVLTEAEMKIAEVILGEVLEKGLYFSFYQSLPESLAAEYLLHDRMVLEYRTSTRAKVVIDYLPVGSTEYVECDMKQMYDGIFAREFLVFFGESIPYYIKEKQEGEWKVTQSGQIQRQQLEASGEDSRYDLIDDMMAGWQMKDEATLLERLENYGQLDELVRKEFTVI